MFSDNLQKLAEKAEEILDGTASEPEICAKPAVIEENQALRFDFPHGVIISVWPGDEKRFSLRVFDPSSWEPLDILKMTPEGQSRTEACQASVLGMLSHAAKVENPAALLEDDARWELEQDAREKIEDGWKLSRWEALSLARSLTDRHLP